MTVEHIDECQVKLGVEQASVFCTHSYFPPDYQRVKKLADPFFPLFIHLKRRSRSRYGFLVLWHNSEAEQLSLRHFSELYVQFPSFWSSFEVLSRFWADLCCPLAYFRSFIIESTSSGLWAVVLTEWVALVS